MEDKSNIIQEAIAYKEKLENEVIRLREENARLKQANFDYNIACTRLEEYGKCLKQALQEIKEIAEQYAPEPITMDFNIILDNQKSNANLLKLVLQKISEVK